MKLNHITIQQLCSIGRARVIDYQGKLLISDHIAQEYLFEEPCRIDALTIIVCVRGRLEYSVNLEEYEVNQPSILVNLPENIIQFRRSEDLEAYAVLVSTELLNSMPYDMLQLATSYLPIRRHFQAAVPLERIAPLVPFHALIRTSLSHLSPETDEIVRCLLQAFMLSIISLMRDHQLQELDIDLTARRGSRQLYERFMDVLSHYHQQERTVEFYADKLCVTPKYLSMAIKGYSGRSPSDWICDYVVAEAKSLLHYSQLSVQEVAFRLNFPSQSAFGKYFKKKTGYSPLRYLANQKV